jgi:hypothetical protein
MCLFLLFCFPLFGVLFGCVDAAFRVLCLVNIPDYTCPGLVKCQSGTNIVRNNLKDIFFFPSKLFDTLLLDNGMRTQTSIHRICKPVLSFCFSVCPLCLVSSFVFSFAVVLKVWCCVI